MQIAKGLYALLARITPVGSMSVQGAPKGVYVIPAEELARTMSIAEFYRVQANQALAMAQGKVHSANLVYRPIKPSDLGLTTPTFSFSIGSSGTVQLLSYTVPNGKYIYIFGVFDASATPVVQELQVAYGSGGNIIDVPLQELWMHRLPEGYFNVGLGFGPSDIITVKVVASNSSAAEPFGLVGFVVEPAGVTMQLPA